MSRKFIRHRLLLALLGLCLVSCSSATTIGSNPALNISVASPASVEDERDPEDPRYPLAVTPEQREKIEGVLFGLADARMQFNFSSPWEIPPSCFALYMAARWYDYFLYDEAHYDNDTLTCWLNKEQFLTVLEGDFGIKELPFAVENEGNFAISLYVGYPSLGWKYHTVKLEENMLYVDAEYELFTDRRTLEEQRDETGKRIPIEKQCRLITHMQYTMEILPDGNVILLSGQRTA